MVKLLSFSKLMSVNTFEIDHELYGEGKRRGEICISCKDFNPLGACVKTMT